MGYTTPAMSYTPGMIKAADMAEVSRAMAAGGALGATGGALATLFQENKSLRAAALNMLKGGLGGAAIGGAVTAIGGRLDDKGPPADPAPSKPAGPPTPHMNELAATMSGYLPGIGPAVHGGIEGGAGQAAKSGLSSLGGSAAGAAVGGLLGKGPGAALGSVAGSSLAALLAAKGFNKSQEKAASFITEQHLRDMANKVNLKPMSDAGGAAIGGVGGAALGGVGGLIKALFDKEDDGIMSTLGKGLKGAAIGGVGGAVAGGAASHIGRNRYLDTLRGSDNPDRRKFMDESLSHLAVPAGDAAAHVTGSMDDESFRQSTGKASAREGAMSMLAPLLMRPEMRTEKSASFPDRFISEQDLRAIAAAAKQKVAQHPLADILDDDV